ncbi:F-box/FBD/LRR-repeat protein At5g53840 [Linum grandiflorum]
MEGRGIIPAGEQEDRISDLPDVVIHDILGRLKSTKEPAKLAILSKRWNHLWRSYPVFDLYQFEFWPIEKMKENSEKFLIAAGKKFSELQYVAAVRIKLLEADLRYELGFVTKVTQDVRLSVRSGHYDLIFLRKRLFNGDHFRNLKVFKLQDCFILSGSSVRFGASLQILSLRSVVFFPGEEGDETLNSMIESASNLETLTLKNIDDDIRRFQIRNCLNLKTLKASEFRAANFDISGAESLETLHVCYTSEKRFQVPLSPNNNVKVLHIAGAKLDADEIKLNEELNKFISKFPRLESLKLIHVPLVPRLKINVRNHKFLRSIWMDTRGSLRVIEIDAPCRLSKLVLKMWGGSGFPDILINQADSEPVVQVSVRCLAYEIYWHEFKRFLANQTRFQLTFEFVRYFQEIRSFTSDVDDESPIPIIEHLKFSLHLCDGVGFLDDLFRNCHPKMISFTETRDEVAEQNVLRLQNMWKYLAGSCKSAKMMKRVRNDDGIVEDREIDLDLFLEDPKRCWIVLDWH